MRRRGGDQFGPQSLHRQNRIAHHFPDKGIELPAPLGIDRLPGIEPGQRLAKLGQQPP